MIDISILICTCNRSKSLGRTLESIEKMDRGKVRFEIILVDNDSKDNTKGVMEEFIQRGHLRIKYLFEKQSGKSFALNTGIKSAKGEIIAFTDDDAIVGKNWLLAVVGAVRKYKDYNCFGGRVIPVWELSPPPWIGTEGEYNALIGTVFLRDDGAHDREYNVNMSGNVPCGVNMFFRREAIEANGPFRIDLGPGNGIPGGSEDTEFCRRMLMRGEKFMYTGSAVVYHPVAQGKVSKEALLRWRYYCARTEIRSLDGAFPGKKIKDVPRYLFPTLFKNLWCWSTSLAPKKRFFYKLKLAYVLGEMIEHYHKSSN